MGSNIFESQQNIPFNDVSLKMTLFVLLSQHRNKIAYFFCLRCQYIPHISSFRLLTNSKEQLGKRLFLSILLISFIVDIIIRSGNVCNLNVYMSSDEREMRSETICIFLDCHLLIMPSQKDVWYPYGITTNESNSLH